MGKSAIIQRTLGLLITAALLLTGCSPGLPPGEPGGPASFPRPSAPAMLQKVDGLGVNANIHNWNNGELKPAIDTIAQMGRLTWRVIVDRADWEPAMHGADPSVYDWPYYEKLYSAGKMADLFDTVAYINSKPGQVVSINVMGGVPQWMGGTEIRPELEDYWVRMIASMVYFGRVDRKLNFTLLSPMNESDWNGVEGPQVGPEQYVRIMHKLSDALDKLGLADISFVGPDTASADKAVRDYLPAMLKDRVVMDRTVHFGIHSYDGGSAGASDALAATGTHARNVWVTEFSGPCPGCDSGAPNPGDWESAQASATMAIQLLRGGMSGLQFYDAWDGYYEHHGSIGYWGLLAYNAATHSYTPRKNYYVMRQLFEFVPPGSALIDCTSSPESVDVVCFVAPGTSTLIVYGSNPGDHEQQVHISSPLIDAAAELASFHTDATHNMDTGPDTQIRQGSATITVGARSVFTLAAPPAS